MGEGQRSTAPCLAFEADLRFELYTLFHRYQAHLVDEGLGFRWYAGRTADNGTRHFAGCIQKIRRRHHAIDQTPVSGFAGRKPPAGQFQFLCAIDADGPVQAN